MRLDVWVWVWMAVGLAVRLFTYVDRPLWLDEALQLTLALSPSIYDAMCTQDLHPPALTLLLSAYASPESVLSARLPSFMASVLTIPLAGWAGAAWGDRHTSIAMAALAALCPPWVLYAGEARPYALGLLAVCGVVAATKEAAPRWVALWGLLGTLAQYGAWPVVQLALLVRCVRDRSAEAGVAWFVVTWVQVVLFAGLMLPQLGGPGAGLAEGALAHAFVAEQPVLHLLNSSIEVGTYLMSGTRSTGLLFVGGLLWIALALGASMGPRDDLIVLALGPLAVFAIASLLGVHPFGGTRHLLVAAPAWFVLVTRLHGGVGAVMAIIAVASGAWFRPALPVEDVPAVLAQIHGPVVADASAAYAVALRHPVTPLPWVSGAAWNDAFRAVAGRQPVWLVWAHSRAPEVEERIETMLDARWQRGEEIAEDGAYAVCLAPPGTACP